MGLEKEELRKMDGQVAMRMATLQPDLFSLLNDGKESPLQALSSPLMYSSSILLA